MSPDRPTPHTSPAISRVELLAAARLASERAYVPYSDFPVGAALLLASGRVVSGCNVENASYGLTICAERTAVGAMVASASTGADDRRILAVAVWAPKSAPCFPCGACRQVLHEFGCADVIVAAPDAPEGVRAYPFEQILPHGFGPEHLPARHRLD